MSARPSLLPQWAMTLTNETVTINGVPWNLPNRAPIPAEFEVSGTLKSQPFPGEYDNQWKYLTSAYVRHLDERLSTGDTHLTTSAEDAVAISTRLGGTWILRGTTVIAGQTNNVWEKTA